MNTLEPDVMIFVWTAKGQQHFKAKGDYTRIAGEIVMHGSEPLAWGSLASRWIAKGYIKEAVLEH